MRHRSGARVPRPLIVGLVVAAVAGAVAITAFVRGPNQAEETLNELGSNQWVAPSNGSNPSLPVGSATGQVNPTASPAAPEPTSPAVPVEPPRPTQPNDGSCSDVEVVFARGTGERPGLGILGTPLTTNLRQRLPGRTVTSYGVDYAAATDQSSAGPGATDMSRHIADVASRCPQTRFVIGGYSQGGTVTDIAIGIRGASRTTGETIPASAEPRVVAVVVFGNPLGLGGRTIESASSTYGPKAMSFCNADDSVCGGGGAGSLPGGHLSYASNGSVAQAADFAASRL